MAFRFTIGRRIGTGFGILILFIIIVFAVTYKTVNDGSNLFIENRELNQKFTEVYEPSIERLNVLYQDIDQTKALINDWVNRPSPSSDPTKEKLLRLMNDVIPENLDTLISLSKEWDNEKEQEILIKVESQVDTLFRLYGQITSTVTGFRSYDDPAVMFPARSLILPNSDIDRQERRIELHLEDLIERQGRNGRKARAKLDETSKETQNSFDFLLKLVAFLGIGLMAGAILVATFTTRSIVRPVHQLRGMLNSMGKGVVPEKKIDTGDDEIGEMSEALNNLIEGFKRTTVFANEVGSGNFDYDYQPLSDRDSLGHALIKMRDDLAENERILEQKVVERTEEVVRQRDEIERQRQRVEELYSDLTDSIRYAKRLQDSILPPEKYIKDKLPDSFVLFRPRDIVSGDFYWMEEVDSKVLFSAVDCTGHGVPGAFMSLVGANALNQAVNEHKKSSPAEILDDLHSISSKQMNKEVDEENPVRDGMDLAMCAIDRKNLRLEYAGANNPLYLLRNGEIQTVKADKFPIGGFEVGEKSYTNHSIELEEGDIIYIFSDGYADQFGGKKGKKFMYRQFRETLIELSDRPMEEQRDELDRILDEWKGSYEQVDDILIIGVRV